MIVAKPNKGNSVTFFLISSPIYGWLPVSIKYSDIFSIIYPLKEDGYGSSSSSLPRCAPDQII